MKLILCLFLAALVFPGCEKEQKKHATSCTDLWLLSPGITNTTTELLPDEYIVRCCELIDGGDNPAEHSSAEGRCMAELLTARSSLMDSARKSAAKKMVQANALKAAQRVNVEKTKTVTAATKDTPAKGTE